MDTKVLQFDSLLRGRLLILAGLALVWLVLAVFLVPIAIEAAYNKQLPIGFLNDLIRNQQGNPVSHYTDMWFWRMLPFTLFGFAMVAACLIWMSGDAFYRRFVHGHTATHLAILRIAVCSILAINAAWEDLASSALIPIEFQRNMGVIELLEWVPGFVPLTQSPSALAAWQIATCLLLVLGALGLFTRWTLPLAAIGALVMGGILRQYSHLFHTMLLPMWMLFFLCFYRCADRLSLDRKIGWVHRSSPASAAHYAWGFYLCMIVMAVTYMSTGTSKIINGGADWFLGGTLKTYVLLDALGNQQFSNDLAASLLQTPEWIFDVLAFVAMYGELFYILVLFFAWARIVFPLLMLGLHLSIFLLMNILFFDLIALQLVVFIGPALWRRFAAPSGASDQSAAGASKSPLVAAVMLPLLVCVALGRFEFYPFSAWQMYAQPAQHGKVPIHRVWAVRASGLREEAPLWQAIPALHDGRYMDRFYMAHSESGEAVYRQFLDTCAEILNAGSDDPINTLIVESRRWDHRLQPFEGEASGEVIGRLVHHVDRD
ncbi:MAG: hypothetical protein DHS20C11_16540 [Lysobacteraceae bacterium]|nr:MAG: hypothetical protein DHS20C11_16540 [Xanthomonadaceae bacterium]